MAASSVAPVVAVTGAAGFIGSRLVPALHAAGVARVVGFDVREAPRQVAGAEHHLLDVAGRDLAPYLAGVDVVVHLAAVTDPIVDEALMTRVNIGGTRSLLAAADAAGVRRIVRVSTAAVYGAWATNPVPLTEDAPLRPNPGFAPAVQAAEVERLLGEWRRDDDTRRMTVVRAAPVLGAGADHLWARLLAGGRRPRIRGEGAPVQVVHVDDLVAALTTLVTGGHDGVYNAAASGWLGADEARGLVRRGALPAIPLDLLRRVLARSWRSGMGETPPTVIPYLVHPWIVATDRLEALGWRATHSNEETLLETHDVTSGASLGPAPAVAGAIGLAAAGGVAWGVARRRRGS